MVLGGAELGDGGGSSKTCTNLIAELGSRRQAAEHDKKVMAISFWSLLRAVRHGKVVGDGRGWRLLRELVG